MISRYIVMMNGVSLADISPKIYISDVRYISPTFDRLYSQLANRSGSLVDSNELMGNVSAEVFFEIQEYNIHKKQQICQDVILWAVNGGKLEINDRLGQVLECKCSKLPEIESVLKWVDELSVGFTAYEKPYWQDKYPTTVSMSGNNGENSVFIPGAGVKTYAEAKITAMSDVDEITVTAGNSTITLEDIGAHAQDEILINNDDRGFFRITLNGESILDKRTRESADDLSIKSGAVNTMAFTSDGNISMIIGARGVWL